MIHARIHTDDYVMECNFDAVPWFERASTKEIADLIECGWRGDYPADAVAMNHPNMPEPLKEVFKYLELVGTKGRKAIGFEVSIDEHEAWVWLKSHTTKESTKGMH